MPNNLTGFMVGLFGFLCVFGIAAFVVTIWSLFTFMMTLNRCSRRNRTLEPALVWLNLIPLLNLVWTFIMAGKIAESLKREFADRDIDDRSDYGKTLGISWATMQVIGLLISWAGSIIQIVEDLQRAGPPRNPFDVSFNSVTLASIPFSFVTFGLLIAYWIKIYRYGKRLEADDKLDPRRDDRYDDYRDDDRDLPPRSSRPDDRIR